MAPNIPLLFFPYCPVVVHPGADTMFENQDPLWYWATMMIEVPGSAPLAYLLQSAISPNPLSGDSEVHLKRSFQNVSSCLDDEQGLDAPTHYTEILAYLKRPRKGRYDFSYTEFRADIVVHQGVITVYVPNERKKLIARICGMPCSPDKQKLVLVLQ